MRKLGLPFVALCSLPHANIVKASPWVEANDPFLRSSIMALSDGNLISGPTNMYPLRWSLIEDNKHASKHPLALEFAQFRYSRQSAQLNRGNRYFSLFSGRDETENLWFADVAQPEWAVTTGYETMTNSYAFRLNTSYLRRNGENQLVWKDSYFAFNAGYLLADISAMPRWWGQGWNHNLILATDGHDTDANFSLIGDNASFGVWSASLLLSKLDNKDYDYRISARLVNKINPWLEVGIAQHYWLEANKKQRQARPKQTGLDLKLTLPEFAGIYNSVYTELASSQTEQAGFVGASLYGWSGLKVIGRSSVRLALEYQSLSTQEKQAIQAGANLGDYLQSSYLFDHSWSVSSYIQFANDHKMSLVFKRQNMLDRRNFQPNHNQLNRNGAKKRDKLQVSYQLPALSGVLKLSSEANLSKGADKDWYLGCGYEFRF